MQYPYILLAILVAGATALPQASPSTSAAPPGCTPNFNGPFHIAVENITATPTSSGTPVSQIGDGQLQAQPSTGICQISDGQLQVHSQAAPVNQTEDGQLQVTEGSAVTQIGDGQLQSTSGSNPCETTLNFTLANGVITDGDNRTLEIVANHQLQADNPPQAGSLYSTGFSICSNGSLALMSSAVFYQCQSGTFFNLYDQPVGANCNPVVISTFSTPAPAS